MVRVFVSGTYRDLVEYREAILKHLDRMSDYHKISMEIMGTSDRNAVDKSISDLKNCQVYLGIIGHRYGTILPDYDGKSITELEYETAYNLHRMDPQKIRILIYLADEKILLPVKLREDDSKFQKVSDFRLLLQTRHTPQLFDSVLDLVSKVSTDLPKVFTDASLRPSMEYTVFGVSELGRVYEEIDSTTQERINKVENFLLFTAETFGSLFNLVQNYASHPFFKAVREKLSSVIPGLSLNPEHGVLKRANVRHVILRTETLLPILLELTPQLLQKVGVNAGSTAAGDLINQTLRPKKYVPASPQVFIALWDFWDRTGGWGEMCLVEDVPSSWKIKITNSFLTLENDLEKTHKLCHFWCGYIEGFLSQSLPLLADLIAELEPSQANTVALPAYWEVSEVKHLNESTSTEDFFTVSFKKRRFSVSLEEVIAAKSMMDHSFFDLAVGHCVGALLHSKQDFGDDGRWIQKISAMDVDIRIRNILLREQTADSVAASQAIRGILRPLTLDKVSILFHQTNYIIQQLVQGDERCEDKKPGGVAANALAAF